jgi:transcription antitermination factor NusG
MGLEIPKSFPWYVLTVKMGREATVRDILEQFGYVVFVPSVTESRRYSDRLKKVQQPLFPGYVFSQFDSKRKVPILRVSHVMGIVGDRSGPIAVPEEEIIGVQKALENLIPCQPWPFLKVGQPVRIIAGPLCGVRGRLERVKGEMRVVIGISLLQRALAVEVDRAYVRPIESYPTDLHSSLNSYETPVALSAL